MSDDSARLSELLDTALELPAEDRERWLESLPPEHSALKPRLRALLARAASIETSDFLDTLPKVDGDEDAAAGDEIGPYRLIREIGVGGMGAVWLAERHDGALKRAVALKFLRAAGSHQTLSQRLQRERDILAELTHPNIARLYDAGISAAGVPWLALEYIEGRHIDRYCREQQLDVRARVALVLQVARAVAYAHSKLVVHRDLKPTNVLVSAHGQTHLLDFGIAKLLEDGRAVETKLTQVGGRALTPEYASPEQILGQPVTTASDVYSLGVILYELLTDSRPYKLKRDSRGALEDAILEVEPQAPSANVQSAQRARALRGDLDAIVLKALKKAPDDRYRTMDALADDLSRYLEGRPVLAQPDSNWYRLRKFVRRNRFAVGAVGAIFLAVLIGAAVAIWQAQVAIAERARAEEANQLMASIFTDADPYGVAGGKVTAVDLLNQAHRRIAASKTASPEQRLELLTLLAYTLNNFQEVERAEAIVSAAVAEAAKVLPPRHPKLLHARVVLALTHRYVGEPSRLQAELDVLVPMLRESTDADPEDLPSALESAAVVALGEGRNEDAQRIAREGVDVASRRFASDHPVALTMQWLLVQTLVQQRKSDAAYTLAAQIMPKTLAAYGGDARNPHVIEARELYARALGRVGRIAEGVDELAAVVAGARELFGPTSVAVCYFASNLAGQRLVLRQLKAARENIKESLAACAIAPGRDSMVYAITQDLGASIELAARRPQTAILEFDAALATFSRAGKGAEGRAGDGKAERALALAMTGDPTAARREFDALLAAQPDYSSKPEFTHIRGTIEHLAGRYAEAIALQQQALSQIKESPTADHTRARFLAQLGLSRVESGDIDAAATELQRALDLSKSLGLHPDPLQADVRVGLARMHLKRSQPAHALQLLQEADGFWRDFDAENPAARETARWLGVALERAANAK
jgi:serine/threonine-protein kinase